MSVTSTPQTTAPADSHPQPTPADHRPTPALRTTAPFDLAHLSIWELRVVIYACGYERRYDDVISPTRGISRLVHTVTAAAHRLGLDTIRAVAAVLEYADLHHDTALTARFCPDTVRWSFTASSATVYREYLTRTRLNPLTVDTLADHYGTRQAVAA